MPPPSIPKSQDVLPSATERLQLALDAGAIVGTWIWDVTADRIIADERFARTFGLDIALCLTGLPLEHASSSIHEEDQPLVTRAIAEVLTRGGQYRCEYRVRQADGAYRWVEANGRVDLDPDGRPTRFPGVLIDIEHRRVAEEQLRETTGRLNAILANTRQAVFLMNERQHCVYANAAAEKLTGYSMAEMQGRPLHDVVHHKKPDGSHYPIEECPIDRAFPERAQMSGEELFVARDGSFYPVAFTASPVLDDSGHPIGTVIEARNIAAEKAAEADRQRAYERLAEETATLETLNRIGAALAGELELERIVQMVTEAGVKLTGAQFGAFFYNVLDANGESYTLYALAGVDRSAFERFPMPRNTHVFGPTFRGEGVVRSADILADPRYGRNEPYNGMPAGHLPVRSYLALPVSSRNGKVLGGLFFGHENPSVFDERSERVMTGLAAQAAIAIDNARLFEAVQRSNAVLEERVNERTLELEQAHEALRQSQKMEAVGQLTGGIAHDFNNMLAVVSGSLDLLSRRLGTTDARSKRYVEAAADGARRAALLTQRLLAFSRQQPLRPEPIEANRLVSGMSDLLRHSLGVDVQLETVLAGGLWRTHADPNQLENVILNLAVNARDAMPEGGKLTIETQNAHLDERYTAAYPGLAAGQYVLIAVTDTGVGMPQEVIEKAFDPFFTTKEVGKGTGLGLSQAYGFMKQSGGHVKIYSEPAHGTTIKLYLQRYMGGVDEPVMARSVEDVPVGTQQEVILVVEDDPAVRQFSVDALSELGYVVLEADGAAAALRLLDARPEIALMFTDVVMPDVNGAKLSKEARRRRPNLKILFTTGYTRNAIVHNGVLDGGVEMIGKPYTLEELAAKVRHVLETPGT